jgi:hypothetical protein
MDTAKKSAPEMVTEGEFVSFEKYTDEEILNTLGVTGDAKLVMLRIHFLDKLTQEGCFASNDALADYLGLTTAAIRNICARLKTKKHLYTLGWSRGGLAFRRVKIYHTIDPNISGVRITGPGTKAWHWRKDREPNPKVIPRVQGDGATQQR